METWPAAQRQLCVDQTASQEPAGGRPPRPSLPHLTARRVRQAEAEASLITPARARPNADKGAWRIPSVSSPAFGLLVAPFRRLWALTAPLWSPQQGARGLGMVSGLPYLLHRDLRSRTSTSWLQRQSPGGRSGFWGLLCVTTCPACQGTPVALPTDGLVMIYPLKHQSPNSSHYKMCIQPLAGLERQV